MVKRGLEKRKLTKIINQNKTIMKKTFTVGQLVRISGRNEDFRYVRENIVRNVKTGKLFSVKYSSIEKQSIFSKILKFLTK